MTDNGGKDEIGKGFEQKASKLAPSKTPQQREAAVKKGFKTFDHVGETAEANGLTDDILAQILEEIDEEREEERQTALKGKSDA